MRWGPASDDNSSGSSVAHDESWSDARPASAVNCPTPATGTPVDSSPPASVDSQVPWAEVSAESVAAGHGEPSSSIPAAQAVSSDQATLSAGFAAASSAAIREIPVGSQGASGLVGSTYPVPRLASSGLVARSNDLVETARVVAVAPLPAPSPTHAADAPFATALPAPSPEFSGNGPATGLATPSILAGPRSSEGLPLTAIDVGGPDGGADGWSSAGSPLTSNREPGGTELGPSLSGVAVNRAADLAGSVEAAPEMADMITEILPFGRATIEEAIDRFLRPFDGLAPSITVPGGSFGLVTASLTVAVTVLTAEVAIRLRRSKDQEIELEGGSGLVRFPGLPGFRRWSRS